MTDGSSLEPVRRPTDPTAPAQSEFYELLPPSHTASYLSPTPLDELQDHVSQVDAFPYYDPFHDLDRYQDPHRVTRHQQQVDPGLVIVMFMLLLVTVLAIITIVAVVGMSVSTA